MRKGKLVKKILRNIGWYFFGSIAAVLGIFALISLIMIMKAYITGVY